MDRPLAHNGISEQDLLLSGELARNGCLEKLYAVYLAQVYPKLSHRGSLVWGAGDPDTCRALFVGEAPGEDENLWRVPFIGPVGRTLSDVLQTSGINRMKDCLIINTETVAPPRVSGRIGKPATAEMRNELSRVMQIVDVLKDRKQNLKAVVCLGKYAYLQVMCSNLLDEHLLTGRPLNVDAIRMAPIMGWHEKGFLGLPVLVTYHPSYIARKMSAPRDQWLDEANDYLLTFKSLKERIDA